MTRRATALGLAATLLSGCSGSAALTCSDLRKDPDRYASEAAKLFREEVGDLPESDCGTVCRGRFTAAIEQRLRLGCAKADGDHDPRPAVVHWINTPD